MLPWICFFPGVHALPLVSSPVLDRVFIIDVAHAHQVAGGFRMTPDRCTHTSIFGVLQCNVRWSSEEPSCSAFGCPVILAVNLLSL